MSARPNDRSVTVPWRRIDNLKKKTPVSPEAMETVLESRTGEIERYTTPACIPTKDQIEEQRRIYSAKMFDLLNDPVMMRSLRGLLRHRDPRVRADMWKTTLTYLMPLPMGPGGVLADGSTVNIQVVSHLDRPEPKTRVTGGSGGSDPGQP